jgi:hypothetical protein
MTRWTKRQGAAATEAPAPRIFHAERPGTCSICAGAIRPGDPVLRDVGAAMTLTEHTWRHTRCPQPDPDPAPCPHGRRARSCLECAVTA